MPAKFMRRADGTTGSIVENNLVNYQYVATSVDDNAWIADGDYEVVGVKLAPRVAGTDASAVTVNVQKCTGTTAPGSGTDLLTAGLNLKGTINTVQSGTLISTESSKRLTAGDRLAINFTGTLTAAIGLVSIYLKKIQSPSAAR
jgi:hypothetical protein